MQKHSRIVGNKRLVWHTKRLWKLAESLPVFEINVGSFDELDMDCWFGKDREPTLRLVADHCRRIIRADLAYPVILHSDGSLMDGGHRICKALLEGIPVVKAVKFEKTPEPDLVVELSD